VHPIQWTTKANRFVGENDISSHLVPRMNAVSPPLLHTPLWSAPKQIYLTCTFAKKEGCFITLGTYKEM